MSRRPPPDPTRRPASSSLGVIAGAVAMAIIAALDIALGEHILTGSIVLGPIVAVLAATPRQVAGLAAVAIVIALISPIWNENLDQVDFPIRTVAIALGCSAAVLASRFRHTERASLMRMGVLAELSTVADDAPAVERLAGRIAEVLARGVADVVIVDGVTPSGPMRLAARGAGPRDREMAEALESMPAVEPPRAPVRATAPDGEVGALLAPPGQLPAAVEDALRSAMVVPLAARGHPVGSLTLITTAGRAPFSDDDLDFARVAAGRAALALDNAGLSSELTIVERQLAAALSSLAEAVTVQDLSGRVVFANEAAAELLGLPSAEALVATPPAELVAAYETLREDGTPIDVSELPGRRVLAGELPPPLLMRARHRETGDERWRVVKATPVLDAGGKLQFAVNVVEDVTEVKRAELAQRLLAEATNVLARSLEYRETLAEVARVAVPDFADWCTVHVPDETGLIEIVALAHTDPEREASARAIAERYPRRMDDDAGVAPVIRDGVSQLVAEIPEEVLRRSAQDQEHLEALLEVGMTSALSVPLKAGARTIGAITLIQAESGRRFTQADVQVAEELGRRAGVAVENSRLYSERVEIADTLQEGLLPPELPHLPGWTTAALYQPAGGAIDVGGDFYDVFRVEGGWMLLVGDVAGRGAAAAGLTAVGRHTLRAAGTLSGDLQTSLRLLNDALGERPKLSLCSVCLVLIPDGDGIVEARVACGGHPAPLLLRGETATPVGTGGPLLGALADATWPEAIVELRPGDQLVLYTDGVIDASGPDGRFGEERLAQTLAGSLHAGDTVTRVRAALSGFQDPDGHRDDRAVLAVECIGAPATDWRAGIVDRHRALLPGSPEASGIARRAVAGWLRDVLERRRLSDVILLVSELVTNGILHGGRRIGDGIELEVVVAADRVRVDVRDPGPGFVRPQAVVPPPPEALNGRGLVLVDSLASRWGSDPGAAGRVWFEVDR